MRLFFVFILLVQTGFIYIRPYLPYIEYELNKKYIAENFCINKKAPEKKCHGKCYRDKKLEENKQEENPEQPVTLRSIEIIKFLTPDILFNDLIPYLKFIQRNSRYLRLKDLVKLEPLVPPPK